jgi:tetratricopeptide (TPR) repeat protein
VIVFTMIKGESGEIGITAAHRAWAWEAAIDMAADHPVLGRGPNVYAVESIQHRSPDEALQADYVTDDPHSVFFAFLTSAGVVGALGFLVLLGWTVARGWRVETGTDAGILAACFFGGAIAYFTQSLLSLDELSTRLALWTVLAGFVAAAGLPEREPEVRPRPGAVRVLAGAVAVLLVAASFWWSARIVMADRHYKFGNEHAQDNLADEAVDEFRAAVADRSDYYYLAGMAKHVGELGTRRGAAGAPYIDEMRRAFASLNGFPLITAITAEAQLLHVWGVNVEPAADEEALALYERAMALNPGSPLLVAEASDVYISLGREEDALARLDRFAAEPVPFARYWGTLALVNAKLGNDDAARDAAATAAEIDPEDPRAKEALDLLASAPGT